jgi:pectinesterase
VSSDVQVVIMMCGPMNLLSPGIVECVDKAVGKSRGDVIIDFMGGALPRQKTSIYREASPLTHVSKNTPSMLLINGEFDRPRFRYTEFRDRLDQHKTPHKFVLMPKAPPKAPGPCAAKSRSTPVGH